MMATRSSKLHHQPPRRFQPKRRRRCALPAHSIGVSHLRATPANILHGGVSRRGKGRALERVRRARDEDQNIGNGRRHRDSSRPDAGEKRMMAWESRCSPLPGKTHRTPTRPETGWLGLESSLPPLASPRCLGDPKGVVIAQDHFSIAPSQEGLNRIQQFRFRERLAGFEISDQPRHELGPGPAPS